MDKIETEKWTLRLPENWRQKVVVNNNQICFENLNHTSEIFVSTYSPKNRLEKNSGLIQSNLEVVKEELKNMLDYNWAINEIMTSNEFIINSIDENKNYRICIKQLFSKDFFVQFTLHDYDYNKRNESNKIVTEVINSIELKKEEN